MSYRAIYETPQQLRQYSNNDNWKNNAISDDFDYYCNDDQEHDETMRIRDKMNLYKHKNKMIDRVSFPFINKKISSYLNFILYVLIYSYYGNVERIVIFLYINIFIKVK